MVPVATRPPRILIVNHHADSNRIAEKLIWMHGFDVVSAETLQEARHELSRGTVDLLYCRISAVDGYGDEFIEETWRLRKIPSVALVGTQESGRRARAIPPEALRGIAQMPIHVPTLIGMLRGPFENSAPDSAIRLADTSPSQARCRECGGTGEITLLISRRRCEVCLGKGLVTLPTLDQPLRQVDWLPVTTRFRLYASGMRTLRQTLAATDVDLPEDTQSRVSEFCRTLSEVPHKPFVP
jgi:hypothetical protein